MCDVEKLGGNEYSSPLLEHSHMFNERFFLVLAKRIYNLLLFIP
jgi:hypothetical protein